MEIVVLLAVLAVGWFLKEHMCISTGELLLRGALIVGAVFLAGAVLYAVVPLVIGFAVLAGGVWVIGAVIKWIIECSSDATSSSAPQGLSPSSGEIQGRAQNTFSYEHLDGQWRAYFVGRPSSYTHVLQDGSRYYVCWSDPLRTKEQAKRVACEWERHYA